MRYYTFEGKIEDLITEQLSEIEKEENVKILHAIESGSRAWGFASPDSDYDVRFIYVRPMQHYLGLQKKADYIDWEVDRILDMNGWDLSKVLQNVYKSNATMYEWANSPIVYQTIPEWEDVKKASLDYFSCKAAMYHYYGAASKNYNEYLNDKMVKYKKYFYVLRPILACKWIEKKECPPPMLFRELADAVLEPEMKPIVDKLLAKKLQMSESEKGERIDVLNNYILKNLQYFKGRTEQMPDKGKMEWDTLNELFLGFLK